MKRRRNKASKRTRVIRLWNIEEANKSLPYLRSVTTSLREHWLEAQAHRLESDRITAAKGRPDRSTILRLGDLDADRTSAEDKFNEDISELLRMDVYPVDAVQGLAFIPFNKDEELAWYVFDLFDTDGLKSWRFHKDPLETRRPIIEEAANAEVLKN